MSLNLNDHWIRSMCGVISFHESILLFLKCSDCSVKLRWNKFIPQGISNPFGGLDHRAI